LSDDDLLEPDVPAEPEDDFLFDDDRSSEEEARDTPGPDELAFTPPD